MSGLMSASSPAASGDPVASPCTSICRMSPRTGLCEGCLRTIDEIASWSSMDDDRKRAVRALIEERRAKARAGDRP